jgi:hypothetical protein
MKTLALGGFLAIVIQAAPAAASMDFPEELLRYYDVETLPAAGDGCTLCHRNDEGGFESITTPYGRALFGNFGVVALDVTKLRAGLQAAESARWDSDRDGIADADELRSGMNPNVFDGMGEPPPAMKEVPLPRTGCTMSAGVPLSTWGLLGSALAALALSLRRRRR